MSPGCTGSGSAADLSVGRRIRALRKIRGISLQQMSRDTGMSYSYLSGLENGKHSVSITNLQRVAAFFQVDLLSLLRPPGPGPQLFRKQEVLGDTTSLRYQTVTGPDSSHLRVSYLSLPPRQLDQHSSRRTGQGQNMILVLSGRVLVMVGEDRYRLEEGDSLLFDAAAEHLLCTEDLPAQCVIVASPPGSEGPPVLPGAYKTNFYDNEVRNP